MRTTAQKKRARRSKLWIPILLILLAAGGGAGYYYWNQMQTATVQAAGSTYNTTRVRTGSITLSASGAGTLSAGQESELRFSSAGILAQVNVQVGDVVEQGQVLAELNDIDELLAVVKSAELELFSAQTAVETLQKNAASSLASAQISLADAEKAVTTAQSKLVQEGWARCDSKTTDAYYAQYVRAQLYLESLGDGGGNQDYYLSEIVPAKNNLAKAQVSYEFCAGYTSLEIESSQASLTLAQAQQQATQEAVQTLVNNNGIDPLELAKADNKVENAKLALKQAQEKLDGAVMKAPFGGTILSVAGEAGDAVGTGAFITIADLAHPRVTFSIDETDFSRVKAGQQATVTFDAVPDRTFTGMVIRVNPFLETVSGYQVITGLIELDKEDAAEPAILPKGLNGSVVLIEASAQDVLLVPLQAVRDLGDGSYGVFVVAEDGKPRLKIIEVGLMDITSVEVKSGLKQGDVVTTGTVETN
jgi:HlyD family secretion protein